MLRSVKSIWITFLPYISILGVKQLTAALETDSKDFRLEIEYKKILREPGYDLNEEDMSKFHIWRSGIIPYYIDDFSFDKVLRDRIRNFLEGVNTVTGLRFLEIPRPPGDDKSRWVLFLNRQGLLGCADHPFKNFTNEGVQRVVLGYDCLKLDEDFADVVLSLIGVPPQHNSPDRDNFVTVMKRNIIPDKLYLFEKLKENEWLFYNISHDYQSAGHFPYFRHTLNGKATLLPQNVLETLKYPEKLKGFSYRDILKIKMLYNYISRNRESTLKLPDCSKLFEPGSKLTGSHVLHSKTSIKPRPKPSRYLGESEYVPGSSERENNNIQENYKSLNESTEQNNYEENDSSENDEKNNTTYEINQDSRENLEQSDNEEGDAKIDESMNSDINIDNKTNNELHGTINTIASVKTTERNTVDEDVKLQFSDSTRKKSSRVPLAYTINAKKQKLLGQSDYETGDEGNKKYIHEKSI